MKEKKTLKLKKVIKIFKTRKSKIKKSIYLIVQSNVYSQINIKFFLPNLKVFKK